MGFSTISDLMKIVQSPEAYGAFTTCPTPAQRGLPNWQPATGGYSLDADAWQRSGVCEYLYTKPNVEPPTLLESMLPFVAGAVGGAAAAGVLSDLSSLVPTDLATDFSSLSTSFDLSSLKTTFGSFDWSAFGSQFSSLSSAAGTSLQPGGAMSFLGDFGEPILGALGQFTGYNITPTSAGGPVATMAAGGAVVARGMSLVSQVLGKLAARLGLTRISLNAAVELARKYGPTILIQAGLTAAEIMLLLSTHEQRKSRRRRRGISYRDLRTTRRTINRISSMARTLGMGAVGSRRRSKGRCTSCRAIPCRC